MEKSACVHKYFFNNINTAFCDDQSNDFYWFASDLNTFTPVNFIFVLHVIWICLFCVFFFTKKKDVGECLEN